MVSFSSVSQALRYPVTIQPTVATTADMPLRVWPNPHHLRTFQGREVYPPTSAAVPGEVKLLPEVQLEVRSDLASEGA